MYFTYSVMENKDICTGCGNCCKKHWLLKLTNKYEKEFFKNKLIYNNYIWTDDCGCLENNKCTIYENRPSKCKEYFCEGRKI